MGAVAATFTTRAVDTAAAGRMLDAVAHRGGVRDLVVHGRCVIAIADRDGPGREAGLSAHGDYVAAFTGTLDNADDLAKELERLGCPASSTDPASICAAAFDAFGDSAPARFRGVFAGIVSDGTSLSAFRDHLGFETLFFRDDATGLYVGSEAKQVAAGSGCAWEPDVDLLEQMFLGDAWDDTHASLKGVHRLRAAHVLTGGGQRAHCRRYWDPSDLLESATLTADELAPAFEERMTQAVRRALTGNDAIALSGGIDAPTVAAFAAPAHLALSGAPLIAVSEVYPAFPSCDESEYIRDVAARLGLPLHAYEPPPQTLDRLQEWVKAFDGPWPTWSPDGAASRFAQVTSLGKHTVLTGELAEQLIETRRYLLHHLLLNGRLGAAWNYLLRQHGEGRPTGQLGREVLGAFAPARAQSWYRRWHPRWTVPGWLDAGRIGERDARSAQPARQRWVSQQLAAFEGVGLSGEANALCQARYGVRVRMPWADVDLWEFFLSLRAEVKNPGAQSKALVRDLMRGHLPDSVLDRRDKTTMNEWFEATSLDYASLRRWLIDPPHRIRSVDYDTLRRRVERADMDLPEYLWAKDLAAIQAFLALW